MANEINPAGPAAAEDRPKYPRNELTIGLAVAAAGLAGLGLLFSAAPSLNVFGAVLAGLGILLGLGGVALGLASGRRGPAIVAAACTTFAVVMLVILLTDPLGENVPDGESSDLPTASLPLPTADRLA